MDDEGKAYSEDLDPSGLGNNLYVEVKGLSRSDFSPDYFRVPLNRQFKVVLFCKEDNRRSVGREDICTMTEIKKLNP